MGASSAQGFHISRPAPADELLPRLESGALRLPGGQAPTSRSPAHAAS
jgi:hypothetical protein